jgi:hypothetical protein
MSKKNKQETSLDRRTFCAGTLGLAILGPLGLSGCGGGAGSTADSGSGASKLLATSTTSRTFVHPGLLHTQADFTRMAAKVAAGAQPWLDGWNALVASPKSQLGQTPNAQATITRSSTTNNSSILYNDIAKTYQSALRWKVSGDTRYADQAVTFLNAWAYKLTALQGDTNVDLAAGIYGYEFANCGEIMRTYSGYAAADFAQFQNMMLNVFYPISHDFLNRHNNADIFHYWANWDQCNIAAILAIGVLCDREDLYNEAINYFKTGGGNGASINAVYYLHPGYMGQWQESGRDQGHCTLGAGLASSFMEMAWNQGDDMYGYNANRFLAGAEYVAKSNLTDASGNYYTMPYVTYANIDTTQSVFSTSGRPNLRPVWEMIYNHYVNRKGLTAPWVGAMAAKLRPEGDGGNGDQLGFGTLTFTRDPIAVGANPSGLTANLVGGQVVLSWWGTANATSYNVKRSTTSGGPYTTIASGVSDPRTYTNSGMAAGTYYYVVTAMTPTGETAPSNEAKAITASQLHTWLKFDETSGTVASDSSGNGHNANLINGPVWTAGLPNSGAVSLDGVNDYLALPTGVVSDLSDFTIATWVYWNADQTWARIFDFGSGTGRYMYLCPKTGGGVVRFCTTVDGGYGEQGVNGTAALPTGQWVHVAVTLSGATATLYVNGVAVGSNTAVVHAPFRLGSTTQNWLGRSQFSADPYFNGKLDGFRIYNGALSAAQIAALYQS